MPSNEHSGSRYEATRDGPAANGPPWDANRREGPATSCTPNPVLVKMWAEVDELKARTAELSGE